MILYDVVRTFLVYAFLGWCTEVAYAAFLHKKFVNRGFLNGPVCPVYGFGAVIVIASLSPLKKDIILMFAGSVLLTSALEYLTGFALDKIFCDKWWDYSDCRFNLHGYICLKFSLIWGAVCLVVMYVIHPVLITLIHKLPAIVSMIVTGVLYAMLITDTVLTVTEAAKIKKYFKKADILEQRIRRVSDTIGKEIADGVLKAEQFKDDITEYRENARTAVKKISERKMSAGTELDELYGKFKNLRLKKGYIYKRLSQAYPIYFDKKSKSVTGIKKYFKKR